MEDRRDGIRIGLLYGKICRAKQKRNDGKLAYFTGDICSWFREKIGICMDKDHDYYGDTADIVKFGKSFSHIKTVCQISRHLPTDFVGG